MPISLKTRLQALENALQQAKVTYQSLAPMADTGLAHDHVWLHRDGSDWVARLPKQSQMNLAPADNLAYEAACYQRASRGGHAPHLRGILPVSDDLPRGGLLVDAIEGRLAQLPEDLPRIAETLASLHRLPIPEHTSPLLAPHDPWQAMRKEIGRQAEWLEKADLGTDVIARLRAELDALPVTLSKVQRCLISFDTHPGNFLITSAGRAVLVDLEKCRYSLPGIDLAHTSLYTSTTWDFNTQANLSLEQVAGFYQHWQTAMSETPSSETLVACRRATWLWSLTWCAKWRAQHLNQQDTRRRGEDWSAELTDADVITHVRDRVEHYLSPVVIEQVHHELECLKMAL